MLDMARFHTLCAAEHDTDDLRVTKRRKDPLRARNRAERREKGPFPEQDLTEIVWAATHFIQTVHGRHLGIFLFCLSLLFIRYGFQNNADRADGNADIQRGVVFRIVEQTVDRPGRLQHIQCAAYHPHHGGHKNGHAGVSAHFPHFFAVRLFF